MATPHSVDITEDDIQRGLRGLATIAMVRCTNRLLHEIKFKTRRKMVERVLTNVCPERDKRLRLQGWVPLGTYVDIELPPGRKFELSEEEEAGLPLWERIVEDR